MKIRSNPFIAVFTCAVLAFAASVAIKAQVPMAPDKYKDIQALKDVPASQVDVTMEYFSAALGWQCQNCHVRDQATGELAYEKNDRKEKATAREMIELVRTVNAGDYGAKINCATCHQGHNEPLGLQPAQMYTPEQVSAMAAQAAARAARLGGGGPGGARPGGAGPGGARPGGPGGRGQQPPPPPVEPIIEKYIAAMGGQAALNKLQSRVITGTLVNRSSESLPFTFEEKGNKFHSQITDPKGVVAFGFDGSKGWSQNGAAIADVTEFKLQQALRLNDLRRAADFSKIYDNLQAGRPTRLPSRTPGGAPINVNLIQGDLPNNVQERLFFDVETGLLLRRQVISHAALNGALVETIDYSDYKDVAGVQVPFTIKLNNWNTVDTFTVVDVKTGASIDDARFARPSGK